MKSFSKNKKFLIILSLALIAATIQVTGNSKTAIGAGPISYCVTEKCKAAEEAERNASERANNAAAAANTLEAEVVRLNQEIAMYEARILANQAVAEDLWEQIKENTIKLELQQQALANMLVNLHFEGQTDTIMILASSSSISDYAEKQSRADTAKTQVNLSAQTIKSLKEDLEAQKTEVERVIKDQELQRNAVAETKLAQEKLIAEYQSNAEAYSAAAAEARQVKEDEIAAEIARLNSSGVVGAGVNSYPYKDLCPRDNLRYGTGYEYGGSWGYVCQCVSYAGWKAWEAYRVKISGWGNANTWDDVAAALGYRVDYNPEPGTIAVSDSGQYGHVMWVEGVNSNGTINLSEYNNLFSSVSGSVGDFGYRVGVNTAGLKFIHFR